MQKSQIKAQPILKMYGSFLKNYHDPCHEYHKHQIHTLKSASSETWGTAVQVCTLISMMLNLIMLAGYLSAVLDLMSIMKHEKWSRQNGQEWFKLTFYILNVISNIIFLLCAVLGFLSACFRGTNHLRHIKLMFIYMVTLITFFVAQCALSTLALIFSTVEETRLSIWNVTMCLVGTGLSYSLLMVCLMFRYSLLNTELKSSYNKEDSFYYS